MNSFTPVLLTVQRDPTVNGSEQLELVAHRWNRDLEHVEDRLIRDQPKVPVPLGTVRQMGTITDDFYTDFEPRWCDDCFEFDDEWPKSWSEINEQPDTEGPTYLAIKDSYYRYQDGVRGYNGTLYVSVDVGRETEENSDRWMPFDEFVQRHGV